MLTQLWRRGLPGDPAAIEVVRRGNPETPIPAFLQGPARMCCALGPDDLEGALALLQDQYWTVGIPREALARAQLGASAWVGAHDLHGKLIATARAVADGARLAYLLDVVVDPAWRGRGLGRAVTRLLLDHPNVRDCRVIRLRTRDMQGFYARLGFEPAPTSPTMDMQRLRDAPAGA